MGESSYYHDSLFLAEFLIHVVFVLVTLVSLVTNQVTPAIYSRSFWMMKIKSNKTAKKGLLMDGVSRFTMDYLKFHYIFN